MAKKNKKRRSGSKRASPKEEFSPEGDPSMMNVVDIANYRRFQYLAPKLEVPTADDLKAELDAAIDMPEKNPNKFLKFLSKLGQGGGGIVYKVLDARDGVIKAIKIAHSMDLEELKTEIAIHALTNHANIVHYEESFKYEDSVWILMELCDGGSLFDLIEDSEAQWSEEIIAYVLVQTFMALASMHRNNYLHRDIKSDNIFISKSGNVKLADFGWAVGLTKEEPHRRESVGTPHWMAPELILQNAYGPGVDVWSVAITGIEMAEASPPFMDETHGRAQYIIATNERKSGLKMPYERSEEFGTFLSNALQHDPAKRPSCDDLLLNDQFLGKSGCRKDFAEFIKNAKK
eukprot:augustus_masked-scaffold_5-processed-gene-11.40-mRNA-1 protein AED:0.04 eAED:0.04 QI:0/-1/0/1/-1/1/1/0/345